MKQKIREILSKYRQNEGYTMEHAERELLDLFSGSLSGYVKIADECYIEDCFDNDGRPIDGRFTGVYLKIDEVKNGGKY